MAKVKFFVNNFPRPIVKAEVIREGNRAVDQATITVPPATPVKASDTITYVQDMADLNANRLIYNFCLHLKDESGYTHHIDGHTDHPTPLVFLDFQCDLTCEGNLQLVPTMGAGCQTFVAGKVHLTGTVDRAFLFDGARYIVLPSECKFDFREDQKFTLSAWFFPTVACMVQGLVVKREAFTACAGYSLQLDAANKVVFELSEAAACFTVTSTCAVTQCMWNHAVVTYNGKSNRNGMKMYVDGELDVTGTAGAITGPILNNFVIALGADSGGGNLFTGRIDAVNIFDKELNSDQIKAMYYDGAIDYICGLWNGLAVCFDGETGHLTTVDKAPSDPRPCDLKLQLKFECNLTDSSCTNSCITMTVGCETYSTSIIDDAAFIFEGGGCGRYITVNCETNFDFTLTDAFSIGFWVNYTQTGAANWVAKKPTQGDQSAGWVFNQTGGNTMLFKFSNGTCNNEHAGPSTTSLQDGEWHYIMHTYDGGENESGSRFFVDGALFSTGDCDPWTGTVTNNLGVTIGSNSNGTARFAGRLDCVRIWKKELTPKEVKSLFQSTFGNITGNYDIVTWIKMPAAGCSSDRTIWHKSGSGTTGLHLHVECNVPGCAGPGFTTSGFTASGFTTTAGCGGACAVTFRHNTTSITGTSDITDGCWHQVRVTRNTCNLISLYVDNVVENCATDTTSPTCEANLEFARDPCGSEQYDEAIASFRWYNGTLSAADATNLFSRRNPRSNVKFGGSSTKIEKTIGKKKLVTQSFGKELAEVEVRANQFCCRTPEAILKELIRDNTCLDSHFHGVPSGITIGTYQADGKLVDIVNDLTQLTGKVYHTDGVRQFHLHDNSFTLTCATFDHRVNIVNIPTAEDDTEIVNCLVIIGQNKRFTTSCLFQGDGTTTTFQLAEKPTTARVETPLCTEKCPEVDYEFCTINKEIEFTCAPACSCVNNILVEYEFERPLNIRGKKQSSIDKHGIKAKRLVLPWITTRNDGVRFINAYLNNFQNINFRLEAEIPGLSNGIQENDVITLTNTVKDIDDTFIIKSLRWNYPEGKTTLQLGEFSFQGLEFAKQITEKIHDLESAVVSVKDLRDFESPEEILNLVDTAIVGDVVSCTLQFPETLALTATSCVTEIFCASYDAACTFYDGDDAYA